jgi:hypothetical protein
VAEVIHELPDAILEPARVEIFERQRVERTGEGTAIK